MATNLVTIILCIIFIRGAIFVFQKLKAGELGQGFDKNLWAKYLSCFVSGVLFANAVPHIVHGISGEDFPAPFGQYLGTGLPQHLSNVIWGFINIVFGYNRFVIGGVSSGKWETFFFFAGIFSMSIFLSFVFSHPK